MTELPNGKRQLIPLTWTDQATQIEYPVDTFFLPDNLIRLRQQLDDLIKQGAQEKAMLKATEPEDIEPGENTVPLCHKCIGILGWLEQPELRQELAAILWQKRFAAFQRWHQTSIQGCLPAKWDRLVYPLWPAAYGGETWEAGSGHIEHAAPRPSLKANLEALKDYIAQVFPIGRGRKKISRANKLNKAQLASKR